MRALRRSAIVLATVFAVALVAPTAAFAQSWDLYDTDSLNRTVPSQNVYTTGSYIKWFDEDVFGQFPDARAEFKVTIKLDGARNSCARLRVITYKNSGWGHRVSKRFPASSTTNYGYYTYCQSDGKGSKTYTGSDNLSIHGVNVYNNIDLAKVSICYTKTKARAPGSDCHKFTVRKGD